MNLEKKEKEKKTKRMRWSGGDTRREGGGWAKAVRRGSKWGCGRQQ